jgi:hypothetical protein
LSVWVAAILMDHGWSEFDMRNDDDGVTRRGLSCGSRLFSGLTELWGGWVGGFDMDGFIECTFIHVLEAGKGGTAQANEFETRLFVLWPVHDFDESTRDASWQLGNLQLVTTNHMGNRRPCRFSKSEIFWCRSAGSAGHSLTPEW